MKQTLEERRAKDRERYWRHVAEVLASHGPEALRQEWRRKARNRVRAGGRLGGGPTQERSAANQANARARRYGVPGALRPSDVRALFTRQPVCRACGVGRGIDHIVDMSRGGTNTPDNLQNLCRPCNTRKYWAERRARKAAAA